MRQARPPGARAHRGPRGSDRRAGYEIRAGGARFEPFANLAYVNLRTDGFAESGGAAALTAASSSADTTTLRFHR